MSLIVRVRSADPSRHLGGMLSAYADRSLPAASLLACDQHVAICPGCRAAADSERRMLSSLRTAHPPGVPSRLESALLDLAVRVESPVRTGGPAPLAVMSRSAPPMYRSPVRAALLASLAAGASAAAAWSLGVSGPGLSGASLTIVQLPSPAVTAGSTLDNPSSGQVTSFMSANRIGGVATPVELTTTVPPVATPVAAALGAPSVVRPPRVSDRSLRSAHLMDE